MLRMTKQSCSVAEGKRKCWITPGMHVETSTEGSGGLNETQSQGAWLADLRSKLSGFSMADWLSSLGLRRKVSAERAEPERMEVAPEPAALTETDGGFGAEDPQPEDDWLTHLWLTADPGRSFSDTLELQHFGPLDNLVPLGKKELGIGHEFHVVQLANPTWCDKCGDFIWGLYKQAVRCQDCNYTCHYKCRMLVTLDCRSASDSAKTQSSLDPFVPPEFGSEYSSKTMETYLDPEEESEEELADGQLEEEEEDRDNLGDLIQAFNATCSGSKMQLDEDGVRFSGYVQIHMNFTRPINIVAGQRPPSIYDVMSEETMNSGGRTITSFFLPRNTVRTLHLTSETTTRHLIATLLHKFKMADNPHKFSLYERSLDSDGETLIAKMTRISDDVRPLHLMLHWGPDVRKRLVLQENDTGDISWDAFEIPELNNFLKILDLEEQQYIWQIRQRYSLYRHYLELEIRERGGGAKEREREIEEEDEGVVFPEPERGFPTLSTADALRRAAHHSLNSHVDPHPRFGTL